ncbi:MAG TPA: universal stress protein [Bryobacteraceae bacterium]|nr:universal stress protein [Bryobacteraceae bacterium]
MKFTHVLFPFDYSERCRQAAPFVRSLIERTGARLTLLNVIEDPSAQYPGSVAFVVPDSERDELLASSTKFLQKYVCKTFSCDSVDAVCKMGDPATTIVRVAADSKVDLIMMPTRGCGGFRAFLLGSVTAKVLHDANCPVWTDAHMPEEDRSIDVAIRSIVCAVDDKDESIWILRCAADLATFYSATLHLVHAVPALGVHSKALNAAWENDLIESGRLQMSELRHEAGANADIHVAPGAVSSVIRKCALECKADLIVIGRGHAQGLLGRLRTNSYAIIRDSPCPVLSF